MQAVKADPAVTATLLQVAFWRAVAYLGSLAGIVAAGAAIRGKIEIFQGRCQRPFVQQHSCSYSRIESHTMSEMWVLGFGAAIAGLIQGISGFAFSMVAMSIWVWGWTRSWPQ